MENNNDLRTSYKTAQLIASYEDLYHVPAEKQVIYYCGDYGGHFFKYGTSDTAIHAAFEKALGAIRMNGETFQMSDDFIYRGGIIAQMLGCMLGPDSKLQDVPGQWSDSGFVNVVLKGGAAPDIPLTDLGQLTATGKEDYAALLNAKVDGVRCGDYAVEILISGVEPQELERFCEACAAHRESEQAMWSM